MFARIYPKRGLGLLVSALLLAIAANLGPLLLREVAWVATAPAIYACGNQSGGC